ncbi:RluA family pseudouridine synthase [Beduini massiliensis]|uniref:RluA family pseudouridine synthase n=1 Tax=Beduini massiliensis TaxID=1585974 RepID=UPI00059A9E65|nr:RluA family pseudouridine synthase [Beduini massiliensis]
MKLKFKIKQDQQLREFIAEHDISEKLLSAIKNNGDLRVNGEHVTVRCLLRKEDMLEIIFPEEKRGKQLTPAKMDLDILYEDEYLLVVNKPAMMPCIPDHRYHDQTLANGLIAYYESIGLDSTIHFVNRLDRETSGLLIVAKYRYIHYLLSREYIERKYMALAYGQVSDQTIDLPIGRLSRHVRREILPAGKPSVTHCHVLKQGEHFSLVECRLETGRTHQIRVHLSAIGHPLIGDRLYGDIRNSAGTYYLHSYQLRFTHPITKQVLMFVEERPIDEAYYQSD